MARPPKLAVQRIAIDRSGYDHTGAYWGAGPPVYIVTKTAVDADSGEEASFSVTLRARSAGEARTKAASDIARQEAQACNVTSGPLAPSPASRKRRAFKPPMPR